MGELELSRPFDSAVLRAVDEGLAVLGESVRDSIYYHLERSYGIRRDEVPERLEAFHQALRGLLGEGGRTVEAPIAKSLHGQLGLEFKGQPNCTLVEYVNRAKKLIGELKE